MLSPILSSPMFDQLLQLRLKIVGHYTTELAQEIDWTVKLKECMALLRQIYVLIFYDIWDRIIINV